MGEGRRRLRAVPAPGAGTAVAAVIGDPIAHSLSPVIHRAGFAALGLDWRYLAWSVPEGQSGDAIDAVRALGVGGLSVTMPHKEAVVGQVDELSPAAAELGAVNCLWWRDGTLIGDTTDGPGLVDALVEDEGVDPEGRAIAVLGAGGAARAAIRALAGAGAATVTVVNRTPARAERAAALAGSAGAVGAGDAVDTADIVINATPVGMGGDRGLPTDPARLGTGQVVVDLVYEPLVTPLLEAARERGAVAVNGLGMLIHQAAHAFRAWTGEMAPLEAMSAAATAELARRGVRGR